jgi:nucleoside-diphosphate-sugar epimerase
MMSESAAIIDAIRTAVPAGRERLSDTEVSALRALTADLIAARPEAAEEYERFRAIASRGLCLPEADLAARLGGTTILVTGGTGCIGSALMAQLTAYRPARVVSASRGVTRGWPRQPGAEYRQADVTDPAAIGGLIDEVRPDIVFHVAAQRSPALAEAEVHRTVSANVLGARNVLAAAAQAGVAQVVCASTGKALRPYSPEIYTASKRAAEWIAATTARTTGMLCCAARFTHVMDNSIIHGLLRDWATADDGVIRLHGAEIVFYVQSAAESAQLLLIAMLGAEPGEFRVNAISDLGWPVSLLDVALGVLRETRSQTPLYISGYDPGYEEAAFPGLYDPATAGDMSPLLNAFETAAATPAPCPMLDSFRLDMAPDPAAPKLLRALEETCARTTDDGAVRLALDDLSWSLLDATLAAAGPATLARCAALVRRHEDDMSPVHRRITQAIRTHAG